MQKQIEALTRLMKANEIAAVALVPSANLFYLTGLQMHLSERVTLALITPKGKIHLIVPALEVPRVQSRVQVPVELHSWTDTEWVKAGWASLKQALTLDGATIAVDYYNVRVLELEQLEEYAPGMTRVDASPLLSGLRLIKSDAELAAMRRAVQVLESSLGALLTEIKPGVKESDIAARWQILMFEHGADTLPESPIVASGPNSGQPHTTSTDRPIETGDLVILDGWCTVDGYFGDITRTVAIGSVSDELRKIYDVTQSANQAGRNAVMPGISCEQVDRAARDAIVRGGYGQYILHRTGHGLGLEIHEEPNMVLGNNLQMTPGMTFTVEPGIYVPGQGGVRIEDDIVVTQDGGESFTNFTRELQIL